MGGLERDKGGIILLKTLILSVAFFSTVNLQGIKSQLQVNNKVSEYT